MVGEGTVFVVDDDAGSLRSLCWLIQQADLSVRPFRSGKEFLHSYQNEETGCLVLDVRMPEMGGLQLQQRLREKGIGLPIIFITAYGDVATCRQAMKEGAFDFFEKPLDDEILLAQIRKAIAHDRERRREGSTAKFAAGMNQLTPSEKDVLDLLISGKSLKEIASVRGVTVQTISRHRSSVLQKVGVENDVELVRIATRWAYEQHR